jgi:hypothetical protein
VIAALMEDFVANPLGGRAEVNLLTTTFQAELQKICHQQAAIAAQRAKFGQASVPFGCFFVGNADEGM